MLSLATCYLDAGFCFMTLKTVEFLNKLKVEKAFYINQLGGCYSLST